MWFECLCCSLQVLRLTVIVTGDVVPPWVDEARTEKLRTAFCVLPSISHRMRTQLPDCSEDAASAVLEAEDSPRLTTGSFCGCSAVLQRAAGALCQVQKPNLSSLEVRTAMRIHSRANLSDHFSVSCKLWLTVLKCSHKFLAFSGPGGLLLLSGISSFVVIPLT